MTQSLHRGSFVLSFVLIVSLVGCTADMMYPTIGDVKDFQKLEFEALDRHNTTMTEQHALIKPEKAAEIRALGKTFSEDLEKIKKDVEALESNLKPLLDQGASVIGNLLSNLAGLDIPIGELFKEQSQSVNNVQSDIESAIKDALERITAMETRVNDKLGIVQDKTESRWNNLDEELKKRFLALDKELQKKFVADQSVISKLEALKDNDAEFRSTLQTELQLTDAEMEKLKEFTPGEILALLGVGGAGAAASRVGPSRNKGQLDAANNEANAAKKDASDAHAEAKAALAKAEALASLVETLRKG